jgi:hypothetical protein
MTGAGRLRTPTLWRGALGKAIREMKTKRNVPSLALGPLGGLLLLVTLLAAGCARSQSPLPQRYDATGIPHSFKRIEQHPQRDFVHHWVRKAYIRPDHGYKMFEPAGVDQQTAVQEWGRPDWIRKQFRSLENDRVQEWLYLDKGHIFQFIGTDLVYEGPLTDYEQTLLSRGYPDRCMMVLRESGEREDLFVYTRVFTPWLEQIKFRDGRIIQSQEGN